MQLSSFQNYGPPAGFESMEEREEHWKITVSKIKSKSKFLNADGIRLYEVPEHVVCIVHCQSKTKRFE